MEVLGEEEIELSLGLSIGRGRNFKKKSNNNHDQKSISLITFDFQFSENDTFESRIQNEKSSSPSCVCSLYDDVDGDGDGDGDGVLDPEKMRREIHKMRRQEARKKQLQKKNGRKYFDLEDGSEHQICKKLRSEQEEEEEGVHFANGCAFPYHYMMPSWIPPSFGNGDVNIVHPIARRSFKPIPFETSVLNREVPMMNCGFEQNVSGSAGSSSSSAVSDYGNGSHHGGSSCETRSHSCQSPPPEQLQLNVPVMSKLSNVQVQSELNTSFNPTECSLVFEKTNTNTENIVCSNDSQSNPRKTEGKQFPVIDPHPIDKPSSVTDHLPPAFLRLDQHSKGANVENFKPPKPQPPLQLKRINEEASKPLISEPPPHQLTGTNGESDLITRKLTQLPPLLRRTDEEARKPFIPEPSHQLTETSGESNLVTPKLTQPNTEPLPRMPCVSTVGNGPNGKTVTGFLYRYTKTEVSIICVCHGCSFSPAEFVKHAGGTDVSNPLKDIVVVP